MRLVFAPGIIVLLTLAHEAGLWAQFSGAAANIPPPIRPVGSPSVVLEEMAPPVIVNGKRADQLSDEELRDFLQNKIIHLEQADGEVEIVRIAPGYPVTLNFQEQPLTVIVGDPTMLKSERIGRNLVMTATEREGDTSVQVFFPGNRFRVYHFFISPTFLEGLTALRVSSFASPLQANTSLHPSETGRLDIRALTQVIANYDALLAQKSITSREVKRIEIFKTNPASGFTAYALYQFASGLVAISFAYRNPYEYPIRYQESRLRVELGALRYLPSYTSLQKTQLEPGESTTGFTVLAQSGLRINQPFEIVWK